MRCLQDIHLGVFFDGTNNNKYRDTPGDSHSNVARLYEAFPGTPATQNAPKLRPRVNPDGKLVERPIFPDSPFAARLSPEDLRYHRKIYIPGVGTPMPDVGDTGVGDQKRFGLGLALLGQMRLDWALLQLCNQVHAALFQAPLEPFVELHSLLQRSIQSPPVVVPRLSPEATLGIVLKQQWDQYLVTKGFYDQAAFDRILADYEARLSARLKQRGSTKPVIRKIRLCVVGFSRGAAMARAWVNAVQRRWAGTLGGIELQVDFLGLFDTVASVGIAHSMPMADGHMGWADGTNLVIPASVRRCVHLVSAHEIRGSFPLDSVCQGERLPGNCKEIVYPGVHSDVGGGYPPDDQGRAAQGDSFKLSQIALAQMYREARMAGVPLADETVMAPAQKRNFEIAPALREAFNAYVEATRIGSVPPTRGKGEAAFARMFPTETQPRETLPRVMRRHYAHQLQWRKSLLAPGAGIAGLAEPQRARGITRHQDIEDLRGAEEELRQEVAFLRSTDPKKFDASNHHNDLLFDLAQNVAASAGDERRRWLARVRLETAPWAQEPTAHLARQKQLQWDTWLREDWERGDASWTAEKALKVRPLFEAHVHDSRAWFKAFGRTDRQGLAPDDEDWFVLGGREAERRAGLAELERLGRVLAPTGDTESKAKVKQRLELLKTEGEPLIRGGREPYRLWGYLRHRHIYQSGVLKDERYSHRQQAIEDEEQQRIREQHRQNLVNAEIERHNTEVAKIRAQHEAVMAGGRMNTQAQKDEYLAGTQSRIAREQELHQRRLSEIERTSAARAA